MEIEVADLVGAEVKRGGGSEALSCAACGPEFSSVGAQVRLPGQLRAVHQEHEEVDLTRE